MRLKAIDILKNKLASLAGKFRLLCLMKKMEQAFLNKDYVKCSGLAAEILEQLPDNVNALRGAGLSCFMGNDYEQALYYLKKSLEYSKEKEFEYTYIGSCLCCLKQYAEAIEAYEKAIEINPLYEAALTGRTRTLIHIQGNRIDIVNNLENNLE